jgi:hypothetical protein
VERTSVVGRAKESLTNKSRKANIVRSNEYLVKWIRTRKAKIQIGERRVYMFCE